VKGMKTRTFMSFLRKYAKDMNPEQSLSLFKNEKYVKSDTRLLNVYSFYVFFDHDVSNTLLRKKDKLQNLYTKYKEYSSKYNGFTLNNMEQKVESLDRFDELNQLYTSYKNLVVNKNIVQKNLYHKIILQTKNEKNISNYRIYTDLKLNQGNTNDYLRNKRFEKLSLENIKRIAEYVASA
jgi:hypothetical protein